jgi:hypothetical protein
MFWLLPLVGLGLRLSLRQWIIAAVSGAVTVLPFAAWNLGALKHANFDFLSALPARPDALTLTNWAHRKFGWQPSGNVAFLLAAGVATLCLWRLRGRAERVGLTLLATYAVFFIFNRWAFANYYYLLTGLSALAAATAAIPGEIARAPRAEPDSPAPPAPAPAPELKSVAPPP